MLSLYILRGGLRGPENERRQVLYVAGWREMKRVREDSGFNIPRIKYGQHMSSNLISFSVDISYLYLESGRPIKKGLRHSGALKLLQSLEIAFVQVMRLCRNGQKVTEARESGTIIPLSVPRPLRTALYSLCG